MFNGFNGALSFFTILRIRGDSSQSSSGFVESRYLWFLIGASIGATVGTVFYFSLKVFNPFVAGVLAVVTDAFITGMLHLDALGDFGDAMFVPVGMKKRVEILHDSRIGTFGVVTLVLGIILKIAVFTLLTKEVKVIVEVAGIYMLSRSLMALVTLVMKPSPFSSIAKKMSEQINKKVLIVVTVVAGIVLGGCLIDIIQFQYPTNVHSILAVVLEAMVFFLVIAYGSKKINGFNGDILGSAAVLSEIAGIAALGVRW